MEGHKEKCLEKPRRHEDTGACSSEDPLQTLHTLGALLRTTSLASLSAPLSSSMRTASNRPFLIARWIGVQSSCNGEGCEGCCRARGDDRGAWRAGEENYDSHRGLHNTATASDGYLRHTLSKTQFAIIQRSAQFEDIWQSTGLTRLVNT